MSRKKKKTGKVASWFIDRMDLTGETRDNDWDDDELEKDEDEEVEEEEAEEPDVDEDDDDDFDEEPKPWTPFGSGRARGSRGGRTAPPRGARRSKLRMDNNVYVKTIDSIPEVKKTIDTFKEGAVCVVQFNLRNPESQSFLNYISGAVYALEGTITKIGDNTFLVVHKTDTLINDDAPEGE